jgi:hypothetical protein
MNRRLAVNPHYENRSDRGCVGFWIRFGLLLFRAIHFFSTLFSLILRAGFT